MESETNFANGEETKAVSEEIITVHNVRGYIDANGTAWLNAEDVARGLGFTQAKDGVDYVMWWRVNGYLKEFGFSAEVRKEDFIPENMFYRLAMKAKNAVAEKFQAKVANEILPALRKHRFYSLDDNKTDFSKNTTPKTTPELSLYHIVKDAIDTTDLLEIRLGMKREVAYLKSLSIAENFYSVELEPLKELVPPADHDIGFLTPTQIGQKLGLTAQKVNIKLVEKGLQVKEGTTYRLTELGKNYGESVPFERNGHSDYQIKWTPTVLEFFYE